MVRSGIGIGNVAYLNHLKWNPSKIDYLDIPSQIEAKFMWRAKEWWKLIYWSTKLTYKIPNRAKIVHSEVWHDTQCASRTEQNCMFMLLLLVHQSQFVTIMAPPSGDNIKGFPLSLSDSKMATRCRPLGPIQIYLQTATDRTAGRTAFILHKEALLLAG